MIPISKIQIGMLLLTLIPTPFAGAAIVQFNDRTAWQSAVTGGGNLSENFNAFTSDVIFRPGRIDAGPGKGAAGANASRARLFFNLNHAAFSMGTLVALGYDWNYLNLIDTPPFVIPNDIDNHVPIFINHEEATLAGTSVRIDFTAPMSAWGADFYFARDSEHLAIDVLGAGDALLGTITIVSTTSFLGFVGTAGEQAQALVLHSELTIPGPQGEAFLMDDVIAKSP